MPRLKETAHRNKHPNSSTRRTFDPFKNFGIRIKLGILVVIAMLAVSLFDVYLLNAFSKVSIGGPVYTNLKQSSDLIADIRLPSCTISEAYLYAVLLTDPENRDRQITYIQNFEYNRDRWQERFDLWKKELPKSDLSTEFIESAGRPAARFFAVADAELIPAINEGRYEDARTVLQWKLTPYYDMHRSSIDNVVSMAEQQNSTLEEKSIVDTRNASFFSLATVYAAMMILGILGYFIAKSITGPLTRGIRHLATLSSGDLAARIHVDRTDEIGTMLSCMNTMADSLSELISGIDERADIIRTASTNLKAHTSEVARSATATVTDVESMGRESRSVRVDASIMEQDATSIAESARTTAVSAEQVSATTREMSLSCEVQAGVSRKAAMLGNEVLNATHRLTASGESIARVLCTIAEIADQAQMATLSIAAGAAADPAITQAVTQVRRLTRQLIESSNDIRKTSVDFVETARSAGIAVTEMNVVLNDVSSRTDNLFLSMKEQATAVASVSYRAADTLERIRAVSGRIHSTAERTGAMDTTVTLICTRTRESATGLGAILNDANGLARLAADMGAMAGRFNLGNRYINRGASPLDDTRVGTTTGIHVVSREYA